MTSIATIQARDLRAGDLVRYTGHLDNNKSEVMQVTSVHIDNTDLGKEDFPCVNVTFTKERLPRGTHVKLEDFGPVEMDWKTGIEVFHSANNERFFSILKVIR